MSLALSFTKGSAAVIIFRDPDCNLILLQDEIDHFGDVGSLDDNVESFLSPDDGDGRDMFAKLKQNPTDHVAETTKGNI